jgi:hypothetical protein
MSTKRNRYAAYDEQEKEVLWILEHVDSLMTDLDRVEEERGKRIDILEEHFAMLQEEFVKLRTIWKKTIGAEVD